MANRQLNYNINFNINNQQDLDHLKQELEQIRQISTSYYIKMNGSKEAQAEISKLKDTANQVKIALEESYNPKLNTMNFQKFNNYLSTSGLNLQKVQKEFAKAGETGNKAFSQLTRTLLTSNQEIQKTKSLFSSLTDTLFNAAKWSVAYGAINNFTYGLRSAWTYAVSLDSALNDIRIVTGKSYQDMEKFAKSANKAAKALGTSTMDYTKGSLIYYQQGLGEKEVAARAAVSAKTANVTGQSMQEVSEELTAVWNGFKVTADETESYVDKLAAVAASSASDLEELSTAMSRVASAANTMGINVDQLTAQIATIESVTRQDAASIGTALKTIYSRMGDLAIGAEDEFGVALGDVSSKMKQMGIDILNQQGNMRDMGNIIEEVAAKWKTWTSAQQQAAAVALAGKRQYNNLFALFENWDMYEANKAVSENSLGELQKQQDIYMESTQAHLKQLGTSIENLKNAFFENKAMNKIIDFVNWLIKRVGNLVEGVGGFVPILTTISSILISKFGPKMGSMLISIWGEMQGIWGAITGKATEFAQYQTQAQKELLEQLKNINAQSDEYRKIIDLKAKELQYEKEITAEQKARLNQNINNYIDATIAKQNASKQLNEINSLVKKYGLEKGTTEEGKKDFNYSEISFKPILDKNGKIHHYTTNTGKNILKEKADSNLQVFDDNVNKWQAESQKRLESDLQYGKNIARFERTSQRDAAYDAILNEATQAIENTIKRADEILQSGNLDDQYKEKLEKAKQDYFNSIINSLNGLGVTGNYQNQLDNLKSHGKGKSSEAQVLKDIINGKTGYEKEIADADDKIKNAKTKKELTSAKRQKTLAENKQKIYQEKTNINQNYNDFPKEIKQEALKSSKEAVKSAEDLNKVVAEHEQIVQKDAKAIKEAATAQTDLNTAENKQKENVKDYEDKEKEMHFNKMANGWTQLASSAMSFISVGTSIVNIFKTLKDESKTTEEKVEQTIMAIIMVFAVMTPTIISMLKLLRDQATASLGWIGIVLAIVSAIVSVVIGINQLIDSRSALEKATDDYKEQVEILNDLQEALTNTKNAYQDLLEEIDNYKSARDGINALKIGTEEWEKAIISANEQALALINTYSTLMETEGYVTFGDNGEITISDEGLNAIKKEQQNQIYKTQSRVYAQQISAKESENNLKKETWLEEIRKNDLNYSNRKSMLKSIYDEALKGYQDYGSSYFINPQYGFEELTSAISNNQKELENLREQLKDSVKATEQNTKSIDKYAQLYARSTLTGNALYENSKNKNAVEKAFTVARENVDLKKAGLHEYKKNDSAINTIGGKVKEKFRKELAIALGIAEEQIDLKMDNGKIIYKDSSGESQSLTKEQAGKLVNDFNIDNIAKKGLDKITSTINKNEATGKSYLNEFAGKSKTDSISFDTLKGNDYDKGWAALMGDVDEDYLKAIGYTGTINDYKEQFQKWYEKSEEERKTTIEDFQTEAGIIGDITNTLTSLENQQIKTILSATTKVSNTLGHETSQAFFDFVNSDEFTADEKETIAKIASTTDFTSLTGINDFINNLESAGIDIDLNNEKYSAFADSIDQSNNLLVASVNNIKDLKTYLSEINKLVKETKVGDILEKEDYQKLISANPELRDAFVETADGYRLVKSVDLETSVKSELSNLNQFTDFYQRYNSGIAKITSKNIAFDETELNSEKLKNQVNQIKEGATDEFYKVIGLDRADIENAVNADKPSAAQISLMQNFISKTKKAVAQGAFSDRQIKELYATSMTTNLDEVEQLRQNGQIDEETYQKARTDKLLDYINALDISIDTYKEFAELVGNDKKALEALYRVQAIDAEIEEIQKRSKNLKGESLAASLEDQNKLLKLQRDILAMEEEAGKKALGLSNNLNYYEVYEAYTKAKAKSGKLKDEEEKMWQDLLKSMSGQEDISLQIKENVVSALDTKLQVTLDENQVKAEWADFKKNYMKVDKNGNIVFKSVIEMNQDIDFESRLAAIQTKTDLFKESFVKTSETIRELETKNTDGAKIKIQALREEQKSQIEEQINNLNDLYTLWTDGWDEVLSLSDEYAEKLEQINSLYSKFISLNNTLNKVLGNNNDFYQAEINNQNEIISARKQSLENAINEYQQAQANNDTKLMESAKEKIESYSNSLLESSSALLDLIKEKAKADIEEIFENLNKASEDWDRTKTLDDRLLNIADSNLNRNQLKRKYQEAFDSTDSLAAQKKIREVMEEQLDILEKKDRLSQYEVDRANAVYELTLKQIALEESQRNASKMKLVRDTNGNLTYSFVQDKDAAAKAQEELEQAQNNLFNIDNNEARNQIDKYYQYIGEWEQKLQQAREEGWSEEEIAKINNYYTGENGLITNIQKGLSGILTNLTSSSEENGILANILEAYKKAKEIYETDANEILTKINKNQVDYVTNWNNAATNVSNAVTKVQELINTILAPENKNSLDEKIQDLINLLDPTKEGSIGKALTGTNFNLSKVVSDETSPFKSFSNDIASFVSAMKNYKIEIGEYTSQIKNLIGKETHEDKPHEDKPGGSNFQYPNQSYYKYDTGGYTGEWGSEGKLAILHQKELVLNANDTANMLAAVQIVRTLDETLGDIGLALAAQSAIPAIKPSLGKINNQNDIVDQNVRIEANFPNVTDKYEIQEAINNLVNLASQKAFDNKY